MKCHFIAFIGCMAALLALGLSQAAAGVPPLGYVASTTEGSVGGGQVPAASMSPSLAPYVGLYADASHSACSVTGQGPYTSFTLWVWWLPGSEGLIAVEYKLEYPSFVIPSTVTKNPDLAVVLGEPLSGVSAAFGTCQTTWVWSHKQLCYFTSDYDYCGDARIVGNPSSGMIDIATCELGYPVEQATVLTHLGLNHACAGYGSCGPRLSNVIVDAPAVVEAFFDMTADPVAPPYGDHFMLIPALSPLDTVRAIDAWQLAGNQFLLTLEHSLVDGTTYKLKACGICYHPEYFWGNCSSSGWTFTYHEPIATLLQSSSAAIGASGVALRWELASVDPGISFSVSRSENDGDFVRLDIAGLGHEGLTFMYTDSGVEPAKRYVYKVEYTLGGASRLLFISEEIRTPAVALALHQNRPNPFNPSTTISFSLPAECAVRLEVYDVSGRLVARLIDGKRLGAGMNNVEWNGRDDSDRAVTSGIYVYRLVAGKETLSRKMVLLR